MLEFILNDKVIKTKVKTGMTLLNFIREVRGLKGTKSGCKEGDCGACTVLEGTLLDNDTVEYISVTSCLTPMANVNGKHIVTVEGVNLKKELNISQLAMKDNYATQCGFCTPGIVVSLTGSALRKKLVSNENVIDDLSGNICRCTGYKSIEKAANDLSEKLKGKDLNNNVEWLIENKFIPEYFRNIHQRLKTLKTQPDNINGKLVGGGTDLYVRYADDLEEIDIKQVHKVVSNEISFTNKSCTIGAGIRVSEMLKNSRLHEYFPNLKNHLKLVSSEQIRNMGTIGGNFVNASPIGDMSIFFLALNSTLEIINEKGDKRNLPFKDFFKSYKTFDLKEREYIESISFDLPIENDYFNFEKVSKRTYLDIASVNSAISLSIDNNLINESHVSIGGVSAIPKYLKETSDFLKGKELTEQVVIVAQEILQYEIAPISDVRGTKEYKRLLAGQLFFAHFIELFPDLFKNKLIK